MRPDTEFRLDSSSQEDMGHGVDQEPESFPNRNTFH